MSEERQKTLLIIGGSGFIGQALSRYLLKKSWKIRILTRSHRPDPVVASCQQFVWDGENIPAEAIGNCYGVVNLAGEPVAEGIWSTAKKDRILNSRVRGARALTDAISKLEQKPQVVIQASAVGYFGNGDHNRVCTESSAPGEGFLAQVCQSWEQSAQDISHMTRLCIARFGLVLARDGGAFPKLHGIYSLGLGAIPGHGKQWTNWIHIEDVVSLLSRLLEDRNRAGVFHFCAPENSTFEDMHRKICDYTLSVRGIKAPALIVKLALGERSSLILDTPRVDSGKWEAELFSCPDLSSVFRDLMKPLSD